MTKSALLEYKACSCILDFVICEDGTQELQQEAVSIVQAARYKGMNKCLRALFWARGGLDTGEAVA